MASELLGQTVIVTGAGSGIGAETAKRFAAEGALVAMVDMNADGMAETAAAAKSAGAEVEPVAYAGSITDEGFVEATIADLLGRTQGIQGLVNVAGITRDARTVKMSLDDFRLVLDVHLTGSWLLIREIGKQDWHPTWKEAQAGDPRRFITSLSSVSARNGNPGQANYCAAKGGIEALTKTIAREYATYGARVNAIAPGPVDTPMLSAVPEEIRQAMGRATLLGRIAQPAEIADAIFKVSTSPYITGQVIQVNGGMYLD
ncbi:MAG: SDR family NAD(P)-dependent oxidoreductase [Myxococcota bacterium]